jgi:hypothetical protein
MIAKIATGEISDKVTEDGKSAAAVVYGRVTVGPVEDHSNYLRRGTLYEDFNPAMIKPVLDVLVPPIMDRVSSQRMADHASRHLPPPDEALFDELSQ